MEPARTSKSWKREVGLRLSARTWTGGAEREREEVREAVSEPAEPLRLRM